MSENDSGSWQQVVEKVLEWLKTVLPLALFSAIVRYYRRKTWFAERKVEQKELELKMKDNEDEVEKKYANMDDADIVRDAISEGRRIRTGNVDDGSESK